MSDYDFELNRIMGEIKKTKARRVGLQLPEGLKQYATEIALQLEEKAGVDVIIFVDPVYGACDTKEEQAKKLGVDLLIHFGHTQLKKG